MFFIYLHLQSLRVILITLQQFLPEKNRPAKKFNLTSY